MYCIYNEVRFFSVINMWVNKNVPIFDIGIFSDRKVSLVGTFKKLKLKIPYCFWNKEKIVIFT